MMPTSKDVAALAGVSQSTVSYVMSGKRTISEKTRSRVQAAIDELTYQPNAGARALASSRTSVIGLVLRFTDTTDLAGLLPFIETITSAAREHDYDVVLVTDDEGPRGLARLAGRRICDAIVLMDIRAADERLESAAALPVPVVLIGVPDSTHGLDAVDFDAAAAGGLAVEELAGSGHDHITLLGEPPEIVNLGFRFVDDFEQGARRAARAVGVRFDLIRPPHAGWTGIAAVADQLLAGRGDLLGLIARTPQSIGWIIQLAALRGLTLGTDMSLIGLCTDATAQSFSVAVTNVSPEPRDVSRLAIATLFERLGGKPSTGAVHLVEPRLTRRATTALH